MRNGILIILAICIALGFCSCNPEPTRDELEVKLINIIYYGGEDPRDSNTDRIYTPPTRNWCNVLRNPKGDELKIYYKGYDNAEETPFFLYITRLELTFANKSKIIIDEDHVISCSDDGDICYRSNQSKSNSYIMFEKDYNPENAKISYARFGSVFEIGLVKNLSYIESVEILSE